MLKRFILHYAHYCFCIIFALWSLGCAARYSTENLRSLAPAAEIIDVCIRMPTLESEMVVFAHNSQSGKSVSDRDWDEFEQFAETADVIYRYDPNAPEGNKPQGLPWPYHNLTCQTLSSRKAPALPKGLLKIPLSESMREALVATLTRKDSPEMRSTAAGAAQDVGDKRFLVKRSRDSCSFRLFTAANKWTK